MKIEELKHGDLITYNEKQMVMMVTVIDHKQNRVNGLHITRNGNMGNSIMNIPFANITGRIALYPSKKQFTY